MIIGGIILILWGAVGGFDWIYDSYDSFMYEYTKLIDELYSSNHNYVKTLMYKDAIIDSKIRTIEILEQQVKDLEKVNDLQQQNLDIATIILSKEGVDNPFVNK